MMVFIYIIVIIFASIILVKSTHWVIKSLIYLAQYLRISEFVIAFILAGLATSFPELFVGISAAINKTSILSLSNVLGSNIANLTLILGLTIILIRGLGSGTKTIQRNILYTSILLIYPLFLTLDGQLSRTDGVALIILFILYTLILFYQSQNFTKKLDSVRRKDLFKNIIIFIVGMALLLISAEVIVRYSNHLAVELNIPLFLIGLFLVAIGTSLPELVFGIKAAKEHHKDMILGNILGSLAVNSTFILGITALISPIIIKNTYLFVSSAIFFVIAYFIFALFARSKEKISWQEGFILCFFYISFIIIQLLVK